MKSLLYSLALLSFAAWGGTQPPPSNIEPPSQAEATAAVYAYLTNQEHLEGITITVHRIGDMSMGKIADSSSPALFWTVDFTYKRLVAKVGPVEINKTNEGAGKLIIDGLDRWRLIEVSHIERESSKKAMQ